MHGCNTCPPPSPPPPAPTHAPPSVPTPASRREARVSAAGGGGWRRKAGGGSAAQCGHLQGRGLCARRHVVHNLQPRPPHPTRRPPSYVRRARARHWARVMAWRPSPPQKIPGTFHSPPQPRRSRPCRPTLGEAGGPARPPPDPPHPCSPRSTPAPTFVAWATPVGGRRASSMSMRIAACARAPSAVAQDSQDPTQYPRLRPLDDGYSPDGDCACTCAS